MRNMARLRIEAYTTWSEASQGLPDPGAFLLYKTFPTHQIPEINEGDPGRISRFQG